MNLHLDRICFKIVVLVHCLFGSPFVVTLATTTPGVHATVYIEVFFSSFIPEGDHCAHCVLLGIMRDVHIDVCKDKILLCVCLSKR